MKYQLILYFILTFSCIRCGNNITRDCPVSSSDYYLTIDNKYQKCLSQIRENYAGDFYSNSATYGYDIKTLKSAKELEILSLDELKSIKALFIEFENIQEIDFKNLPNIEYVYLENVKEITTNLLELKKLEILIIRSNKLKTIPEFIGDLKGLRVFAIISASKLEKISNSIGNLPELECRLP